MELLSGQDYGLDKLLIEPLAVFTIDANTSFRVGLNFIAVFYNTPVESKVLKNNNFSVGLPIGITVKY